MRLFILGMAAAILAVGAANAHGYKRGALEIEHPWARATPPAAKNGAAYLEILNSGAEADRLVGASSPAAASVELHETVNDGGVLRMRAMGPVDVKPGDVVAFEPGRRHIMLIGLKAPLRAGTEIPLTLQFEKAGAIEVEIRVEQSAPSHGAAAPHRH